ncbi:MAG: hypothetical protein ABI840_03475 [bacterium]
MNRKKLKDIIIGCLLISSLSVTTFIVSCSDQDNIISNFNSNSDQSSPYHQHIHGQRGIEQDAVTAIFAAVGQGAAREVGSVGMGWALSSMGLVAASPDWQAEFKIINNDLTQIINLLTEADEELASIENTLKILNCSEQQTSLQEDIGAIINEFAAYNSILVTASKGDTVGLYNQSLNFANSVINGLGTQPPISTALSNIQANVNTGNGVVVSCLQPISKPANGTFRGDSVYYESAQSLLNYYYYYQTIGLGLLSEAYHWKAWVAAGGPGSGQGYSSDSVQLICDDKNAEFDCNYVEVQTNNVYNTLLIEFKEVGSPYTGEDLLFQKNLNGENIVWVRSLEDYTEQSKANCNFPVNINNLCGPTVGKSGSTLSYTTYYGTQNFIIPSLNELNGLVNPTPTTNGTVGKFLDSVGFENMNVNPPKVLIADTLIKLTSTGNDFSYYIDTMTVIPYISPGYPVFTQENYYGDVTKRAIYSELYDFIGYNKTNAPDVSMYYTGYTVISNAPCSQYSGTPRGIQTTWFTSGSALPWGGPVGYSGNIQFCQQEDGYNVFDITPFAWTSTSSSPGWSYYSKNSSPQNAFFIPVRTNFSGSAGCLSGYSNLNSGGFITKCGDDFQTYLTSNLPIPPTCDSLNVTPPCTPLP